MISRVREKLEELDYLIDEQEISFDRIDSSTFLIEGRIVFVDGSILEFIEYSSPENHDYRFQYMDDQKELFRRWDSSPHHEIENFPFHLHIDEETVESSPEKNLVEVLDDVELLILSDHTQPI
jgi:hypothetical protein